MSGQPDPEPTTARGSNATNAQAKAAGAAPKAPPRGKARAKAAGFVGGNSSVPAAAGELAANTGFVPRAHPATPLVPGALPAQPSSTGRRYYVFRPLPSSGGRPLIAAGQQVAVNLLGGSWLRNDYGRSPQGYTDLESAVNSALRDHPNEDNEAIIRVVR